MSAKRKPAKMGRPRDGRKVKVQKTLWLDEEVVRDFEAYAYGRGESFSKVCSDVLADFFWAKKRRRGR